MTEESSQVRRAVAEAAEICGRTVVARTDEAASLRATATPEIKPKIFRVQRTSSRNMLIGFQFESSNELTSESLVSFCG